ncbi:hypothetical protein [Pengzhenrongella sp.]|jgi:membrane glycosyltransferase|uniref:hypothetical protein n=1 Tax=Pengzhenrongella sp. TaxID=2888820 RepID=UPI002F94262F
MSFQEKRAWIYAVITACVPAVYFALILGRARSTDVAEVAYIGPMLTAIVVAIVVNIVAEIFAGMASPKDAGRKDERDTQISRRGERVEYYVLVAGVIAALGLTMVELDYFWIANAIYGAFTLSSLFGAVARIVAYRRGL